MKLKHVALYSKLHYERSGNVWGDLRKCLRADDYTLGNKNDILRIIIRNVTPLFCYDKTEMVMELVCSIHPSECWKSGFYTKDHEWAVRNDAALKYKEYDQQEAILFFYLSKLQSATKDELDGLPEADENVLPFSQSKLEYLQEVLLKDAKKIIELAQQ